GSGGGGVRREERWLGDGGQAARAHKKDIDLAKLNAAYRALKDAASESLEPVQVLAAQNSVFNQPSSGRIGLHQGSLFLNTPQDTTIHTSTGDVHAEKGALLAIEHVAGTLRVKSCSEPGTVWVSTGGSKIPLGQGKE